MTQATTDAEFYPPVAALFRAIFFDPAPRPKPSWAYCVWNPDRNVAKIGFSKNPIGRFKQIRAASADNLLLVGCIPGGRIAKSVWQEALSDKRVRGDWFDASDGLIIHGFLEASLRSDGVI